MSDLLQVRENNVFYTSLYDVWLVCLMTDNVTKCPIYNGIIHLIQLIHRF